ncbi:MAG TPA: ribosome silencing factor [Gaiellaceae bacterium]|nr:ribosome silencing factor [Gaiellaceae bacterium]
MAGLAQEKLARDVVILDMRPVCTYTDYFVICTGQNSRQTKAIYDEVRESLKRDERAIPRSVEGDRDSTWIVADYLDVVLHVFTPETRRYYRLEELWGDVPSVELEAASRSDDREEVIRERLKAYDLQTRPVAEYYEQKGRLVAVNGDLPIGEVTGQVFYVIEHRDGNCL